MFPFFCCPAWQNLRNLWMRCPAAASIFDLYWPTSTCLTHPKLTGGPPVEPVGEPSQLCRYPAIGTVSISEGGWRCSFFLLKVWTIRTSFLFLFWGAGGDSFILNLKTPKRLIAQLSASSLGSLVQSDLRSHMGCAVWKWRRLVQSRVWWRFRIGTPRTPFRTSHVRTFTSLMMLFSKLSILTKEKT